MNTFDRFVDSFEFVVWVVVSAFAFAHPWPGIIVLALVFFILDFLNGMARERRRAQ